MVAIQSIRTVTKGGYPAVINSVVKSATDQFDGSIRKSDREEIGVQWDLQGHCRNHDEGHDLDLGRPEFRELVEAARRSSMLPF